MKNKYEYIDNGIIKITLHYKKNELFTYISEEDFATVNSYNTTWYPAYSKYVKSYYCYGTIWVDGKNKNISLHRVITGVNDRKIFIDHINHNTLDNTRENLRVVTNSENRQNSRLNSNNTSGYTGVGYHKQTNKFEARIRANRKYISLGYFKSADDAHNEYLKAKEKYHIYWNSIKTA